MDYWELGDWEQSREYWNQLGKQLGIARRQITDAEVAKIRERLPYGPPPPQLGCRSWHLTYRYFPFRFSGYGLGQRSRDAMPFLKIIP